MPEQKSLNEKEKGQQASIKKNASKKVRQGTVSSDCQDKTIVVTVVKKSRHKRYNKIVKSSKKYYTHDEKNLAKKGDVVTIIETRPLSKLKRWRLVKVDKKYEV